MSSLSLSIDAPAAQAALRSGYLELGGGAARQRVIARERVQIAAHDTRVVFEVLPDGDAWALPAYFKWWRAMRPSSLTTTLTPALVIWIYGGVSGWAIHPWLALTSLAGASCLLIAVNAYNDFEDHVRLIDFPGGPGGSGVIQKGWLTPLQVRGLARTALAVGVGLGLPSLLARQCLVLFAALLGGLGVLGYSGRPLSLKYRALGDLAVFALCGPGFALGFSAAAFGRTSPGVVWIGAYFGLAAMGILLANHLHDAELDLHRGARSLASILGFRRAQKVVPLIYLGCFATLVMAVFRGELVWPVLAAPWLALPWIYVLVRRALKASGPISPLLSGLRWRAIQAHLILGVFLGLAFLLARQVGG